MSRRLVFALSAMLLVAVTACQTTTDAGSQRYNDAYYTLRDATGLDAPGVHEALAYLAEAHQAGERSKINLPPLIYKGAHDDVIMALIDIYGADEMYQDYFQRLYHDMIFDTPYSWGNAFQLAVSAQRPDLAQRIAIRTAMKAGDYREGVPLGSIDSINALATQRLESRPYHFNYQANEPFWNDTATLQQINSLPLDTYVNPAGRGLLFRYAASQRPGWRYETVRQFGEPTDALFDRLGSPSTHRSFDSTMDLAPAYEKDLAKWSINTVQFILKNFGGDVNETLPYCMLRYGEPVMVCPRLSPTHLAARNSTMVDLVHQNEWLWLPAGKLQGFLVAGGNSNQPDSYGITPLAYARTGGIHPGSNGSSGSFDIG